MGGFAAVKNKEERIILVVAATLLGNQNIPETRFWLPLRGRWRRKPTDEVVFALLSIFKAFIGSSIPSSVTP